MDDFRALVTRAQQSKSPKIITNASLSHAAVLVEKLLKTADEDKLPIRIVSGCMASSFYEQFCGKFKDLLGKGLQIRALVEDDSCLDGSHSICEEIRSHKNGSVLQLPDVGGCPHFILVGDRVFRLETNHDLKSAKASFDDPVIGKMLLSLFDDSWNKTLEAIDATGQDDKTLKEGDVVGQRMAIS